MCSSGVRKTSITQDNARDVIKHVNKQFPKNLGGVV